MALKRKEILLSVEGAIDEHSEIFRLDFEADSLVRVDLRKLAWINSIGVKRWIDHMGQVDAACELSFENCPFFFVKQAVLVTGFLPGNGFIASFFAPYFCDSCSQEKDLLLRRGVDYEYAFTNDNREPRISIPREISCGDCSSAFKPDFVEKRVFAFLEAQK